MGCSNILETIWKTFTWITWEIWHISIFVPVFTPGPPLNLAIPSQQKLVLGNEKDMGYHVNEFRCVSFKTVVFQAFENWLKFGQIRSKNTLFFLNNSYGN